MHGRPPLAVARRRPSGLVSGPIEPGWPVEHRPCRRDSDSIETLRRGRRPRGRARDERWQSIRRANRHDGAVAPHRRSLGTTGRARPEPAAWGTSTGARLRRTVYNPSGGGRPSAAAGRLGWEAATGSVPDGAAAEAAVAAVPVLPRAPEHVRRPGAADAVHLHRVIATNVAAARSRDDRPAGYGMPGNAASMQVIGNTATVSGR